MLSPPLKKVTDATLSIVSLDIFESMQFPVSRSRNFLFGMPLKPFFLKFHIFFNPIAMGKIPNKAIYDVGIINLKKNANKLINNNTL